MTDFEIVCSKQDAISSAADRLIRDGLIGHPTLSGDRHPAWLHTGELSESICRITAIQLAENRARAT